MRKVVLSGPSVGSPVGSVKIDVWLPLDRAVEGLGDDARPDSLQPARR